MSDANPAAEPALDPLRSVHTTNLPDLFRQLGISLVVTTYQAGKVILVRQDGEALNTHFRTFEKPMGVAVKDGRIDLGSGKAVWTLHNMSAVARKLEPAGKYDAAFLPRRVHVTGNIDIHEMAHAADGELWIVNTRFSCLCTLDWGHSFTPRWRPPFVTAYAPEDRCHLNGLGLRDGRPRYVTALGATDTQGGWRENKANGGILMDISNDEVLLDGLSMPHSPRWYRDRLWFLESGNGSIAYYEPNARTWVTVATVPGFTRGLDFVGPLAFIGLSQVRESAVFSGIPLVERLDERVCGVWVVNIETGKTVGFIRFEEGVQEIFGVQVLPGIRFPEILEWGDEKLAHSYVLPDAALAEVPPEQREPAVPGAGERPPKEKQTAYERKFYLGLDLLQEDHWAAAVRALEGAVRLDPGAAEAHNNLANGLSHLNRLEEAVPLYERAIELKPDYAHAHQNLGMALLKLGDLPRGFEEFAWRWKTPEFTPFVCPQPEWDGTEMPDKTLLVFTEQGAGDAMQCARFIPEAARRMGKLILVAPDPLRPLLAGIEGVDELRGPGQFAPDAFDAHLPVMSLPRVLGTTLETIPSTVPYLIPPADRTVDLPPPPPNTLLKVGIAWAGSPTQGNDRNRSSQLRDWGPVLSVPGVAFYSLQVGPRAGDLAGVPGAEHVTDLAPRIGDWADTALALHQLDLVLGVDTGVVHLAGALGRPVWVALCFAPDWRWLDGRDDSPWYPTMRLFRQDEPKRWPPVTERMAEALRACVDGAPLSHEDAAPAAGAGRPERG